MFSLAAVEPNLYPANANSSNTQTSFTPTDKKTYFLALVTFGFIALAAIGAGVALSTYAITAFGKTMTSQLPVLNHQNKAISNPNAMDVNTAMQRCLAKAIALHGLGLYIYAGEDVPDEPTPDLTSDAQLWIDSINECETIDQLKDLYGKAYAALSKDKNAVQMIANAKDIRKVELS